MISRQRALIASGAGAIAGAFITAWGLLSDDLAELSLLGIALLALSLAAALAAAKLLK